MKVLSSMTFRDWLALFLVNAFCLALFWMMRYAFPKTNEQLIVYMLGQLSGFTGTALAVYFTVSRHDEQRDEQRSENTKKLVDTVKSLAEGPTGTALDPVHTTGDNQNDRS